MCDELYGRVEKGYRLGLRAVRLAYKDTFTRRPVSIVAPAGWFLKEFGFANVEISRPEKVAVKIDKKPPLTPPPAQY
jgi:hypothetical protein